MDHENLYIYRRKLRMISTNNIARGMVRDRHEYAFNPPKYVFNSRKAKQLREEKDHQPCLMGIQHGCR
jgi:hypothetical protein